MPPPRCARPLLALQRGRHEEKRGKNRSAVKLYLFSSTASSVSASACICPGRSEPPTRGCCFRVRMPSAQPPERSAGITWTRRLDSPLYLSRFSLRCSLINAASSGFDVDSGLYFRLSLSLFFLSLIPPNQGGARLAVPISPLKTPARLQLAERTVSSAAWQLSAALIPGAPSPLLLSDSFFSFSFFLFFPRLCRNFWHQPLWIQSCRTPIYLLPSFLIRVQSWLSGRCDITSDTNQRTPLIHPLLF